MKKKNIVWLLSAAMIMTTVAAPMEHVYAAEEFQAEGKEAGEADNKGITGEKLSDAEGTDENAEVLETPQDISDNQEMLDDDAEELNEDIEVDSSDAEKLEEDMEDIFSDGKTAAAGEDTTVVESGGCGESAEYKLYSDGSLFIEGRGTITGQQFQNNADIETVVISEGITGIGNSGDQNIFSYCKNLRNIIFPKSLVSIGDGAFFNCNNLNDVTFPDGLKNIENNAFCGCIGLQKVVLPDSIIKVGENAFSGCSSLKNIIIPQNLEEIAAGVFQGCPIREISIPDHVKIIGNNAFFSCENLKEITLPETITKIDDMAFYATGLKTVNIPDSVTYVGDGAFLNCSDLKSVKLPDKLKYISGGTFRECRNLTHVTMPTSLKGINANAFEACESLTEITLPEGLTEIGESAFAGSGIMDFVLPESLKNIGKWAFSGCKFNSIKIPETVTEIGEEAFASCKILGIINIPKNMTEIEDGVFRWCENLKKITLPESIIRIGEHAFSGSGIEEITLPEGLKTIDEYAFSECYSLKNICIPEKTERINEGAFQDCRNLASVYIAGLQVSLEEKAIGYSSDGMGNFSQIIIGQKDSTAEKYAVENQLSFHNIADLPVHVEAEESTCADAGNIEYWHCNVCGNNFSNAEGTKSVNKTELEKPAHKMVHVKGDFSACTGKGIREHWHCEVCGGDYEDISGHISFENKETPAEGHEMSYEEGYEATCTTEGRRSFYHCWKCDKYFLDEEGEQEIQEKDITLRPNNNHDLEYRPKNEATCTEDGRKATYYCYRCDKEFLDKAATKVVTSEDELKIPKLSHKWGKWEKMVDGDGRVSVLFTRGKTRPVDYEDEVQDIRECLYCGEMQNGKRRTYRLHINADQCVLRYGQSTTALKASGFLYGDYVTNVVSENPKVATVSNVSKNGTFKVTAKNKEGLAKIRVEFSSGLFDWVRVYVQKGKVTTKNITGLRKSVSVVRGKTFSLKPVLDPITSEDKITYTTSNKNIASVNSKGVITGKRNGTAKITVKAGSKKVVVTVYVTKIKTTNLTGIPENQILSKGKTFTIKAVATPKNTEEKITYKSSNTKVATVTSKGVVKGIRKGTAVITVQSGSKKMVCKVTVK